MLLHVKLHWTIALATVIPLFSLNMCIGSTAQDLKSNSNEFNENTKITIEDPAFDREQNKSKDKRKWSKFASWGKRDWANNKQLWGKKRWSSFPTWGKRSIEIDDNNNVAQFAPEKRKWNQFVSWGKRDFESQHSHEISTEDSNKLALELATNRRVDQRAWSKLSTWGKREMEEDPVKRRWSQLSQLSAWGKGDDDFNDVSFIDSEDNSMPGSRGHQDDKRNWSKFVSWGKRANINFDNLGSLVADKRAWSKFPIWGKRSEDLVNLVKRKWSQLITWGKRNLDGHSIDKKAWSKFASWGKRYLKLNPSGKRRWSPLAAWGKRSDDSDTSDDSMDVARKLLTFFDVNGDGVLDLYELQTYTETVMAVTTNPKSEDDAP